MYECCADTSLSPTSQLRLSELERPDAVSSEIEVGVRVMILGQEVY